MRNPTVYPNIPRVRRGWTRSDMWLAIFGGVGAALAGSAIVLLFLIAGAP